MKSKKKVRKAKPKIDKPALLDLFLQTLAELYPRDPLAPGLVLAYLPKEKVFYASVCRYDSKNEKQVLVQTKESTLLRAIYEVTVAWHSQNKTALEFTRRLGSRSKRGDK